MADPEYFTIAELRALPQMSDATKYPESRCLAAAAYVTAIIEREVGAAFISRTITAEVHDGGTYGIALDQPYARSITSATENGVAVTDELRVKSGILRRFGAGSYSPGRWASGIGNVSVTYAHGYSTAPPADIKEAAIQATRARLLSTNSNAEIDDRRTSINTEAGTVNYVIAGSDRPTGYPEVDAVILGWKAKLNNFGFA